MRSLSSDVIDALNAGTVRLVQLLLIEHPAGDIALNSSTYNLPFGGRTYVGAAALGTIAETIDGPGEIKGLTFELSAIDAAMVGVALDELDQLQGSPVTLRTAIVSTSTFVVLDAPVEWVGYMDTAPLTEDGASAVITATAEHAGVDLLRGKVSYYNDNDQQRLYPGDRAFEYVNAQQGQRVMWPSREWYQR